MRGGARFVGRAAELELFRGALEAPEPPFSVLWIHGPGGVGKTTLLGALADVAAEAGAHAGAARPAGDRALAVRPSLARAPADALDARATRPVLLLDTFEARPRWRTGCASEFLPGAARPARSSWSPGATRPAEAWRRDPGWRDLLRVISLRNLDRRTAREPSCARAGVPDALHDRVLELTHGHPLALSLLLDVLAQSGDRPPPELSARARRGRVALVAELPGRRSRARATGAR